MARSHTICTLYYWCDETALYRDLLSYIHGMIIHILTVATMISRNCTVLHCSTHGLELKYQYVMKNNCGYIVTLFIWKHKLGILCTKYNLLSCLSFKCYFDRKLSCHAIASHRYANDYLKRTSSVCSQECKCRLILIMFICRILSLSLLKHNEMVMLQTQVPLDL